MLKHAFSCPLLRGMLRASQCVVKHAPAAAGCCTVSLQSPLPSARTLLCSTAAPTRGAGLSEQLVPYASIRHLSSSTAIRDERQATHSTPGPSGVSLDPREAAKFAALSREWWETKGPFAPLHRMNPTRCRFIREAIASARSCAAGSPPSSFAASFPSPAAVGAGAAAEAAPLAGLQALDVGCGGGLLSESLARLGALVHGVDVSEENVQAARVHAAQDVVVQQRVRYEAVSLEQLAAAGRQYDVVVASEVIEHVRRPDLFVASLASVLKPDGQLIISTLNRTLPALALAIGAAEYVTGMVPRGTHDWHKFITPQELALMGAPAGLTLQLAAGMHLDILRGSWSLDDDLTINYITMFTKSGQL